jgi:hypothetical protein
MADLVITAASVVPGAGSRRTSGIAGASIAAGKPVYQDPADLKYKLADANSGTAAARAVSGISLNAAENGQPLAVHLEGPLTIGAAVSQGVGYFLSSTAGGICPAADLASGAWPTLLGFAISASVIDVKIHPAGVALP